MLQPETIQDLEREAHFLYVPTNDEELSSLVALLDEITDIVRDNETHPLANLMDVLGTLIEVYENENLPEPEADPLSILKHFMEEFNLRARDLPELGNPGDVTEILSGKRDLNDHQIRQLSERFKVPTSVFL